MIFASRSQAGQMLGGHLLDQNVQADIVLGLPRGGVVVAAEIARVLQLPLDVLVVRKIGHPRHREFAVGALAECDVFILNEDVVGSNQITRAELEQVIVEETNRLKAYIREFHRRGQPVLTDKRVLLVDDGLATGTTMQAAVQAVTSQNASRVMVAVPVASPNTVQQLAAIVDDVFVLHQDAGFDAVGRYYDQFDQVDDTEVTSLLAANR